MKIEVDVKELKYKGFTGSINYSDEDKVFYGKLEGINGLISYEAESFIELIDAFNQAVDEYVEAIDMTINEII